MPGRGRPRTFDRNAALRTAMELFWEHGYEGTSLSMLTAAMGITSTSLYAAFDSKEELFREAVELYNSADGSPTANALDRPTAREAVEAVLRGNADAYTDPATPRGCMVVLSGLNLTAGHEPIGRYLAELRHKDYLGVRERLRRGTAEGDLPAGADTAVLASFALTVLHGLSVQARDGASRERLHAVIDTAMLGWDALLDRAGTAPGGPEEGPAGQRW